jgi:hypothetical protein
MIRGIWSFIPFQERTKQMFLLLIREAQNTFVYLKGRTFTSSVIKTANTQIASLHCHLDFWDYEEEAARTKPSRCNSFFFFVYSVLSRAFLRRLAINQSSSSSFIVKVAALFYRWISMFRNRNINWETNFEQGYA